MARRHEQVRREVQRVSARDPRDTLSTLAALRDEADACRVREHQEARQRLHVDGARVVLYCHGPGWPVVACTTLGEFEEAQAYGELRGRPRA